MIMVATWVLLIVTPAGWDAVYFHSHDACQSAKENLVPMVREAGFTLPTARCLPLDDRGS